MLSSKSKQLLKTGIVIIESSWIIKDINSGVTCGGIVQRGHFNHGSLCVTPCQGWILDLECDCPIPSDWELVKVTVPQTLYHFLPF